MIKLMVFTTVTCPVHVAVERLSGLDSFEHCQVLMSYFQQVSLPLAKVQTNKHKSM